MESARGYSPAFVPVVALATAALPMVALWLLWPQREQALLVAAGVFLVMSVVLCYGLHVRGAALAVSDGRPREAFTEWVRGDCDENWYT